MVTAITAIKAVLLLLSATGYYFTWHLASNNGTIDYMVRVREFGPRVLPGTTVPLKIVYTGIHAVDHQLTALCLFFWELVDGSQPNASLLCFHFAGQITAAWGLLTIEKLRYGHQGRVIALLVIWGLAMQNVVMAVVMPLYLFVHLSTSPTVSVVDPTIFSIELIDLGSILVSLIIGYILPSILIALPAPSILSFDQKQIVMAVWQVFPIWAEILQRGVSFILRKFSPRNQTREFIVIADKTSTKQIGALRLVYAFLVLIAGLTHIATMTFLATSVLFPRIFAVNFAGKFDPSAVFRPVALTSSTKISSLGSGTLMLIQYDEMIGSLAMAIWAVFMLTKKMREKKKFDTPYIFLFDFVSLIALLGPIGYAVVCIWARDELVFEGQERQSASVEEKENLEPNRDSKEFVEK